MKIRISLLISLLLVLLAVAATSAQTLPPKQFHPRELKPVSQVFINGLSDLGNIQVFATYQCGGLHRADWDVTKGGIWVKLTGRAFVFYGSDGLLHIHAFVNDPPSAIHGFTPGIRYARIPDYSLQNVDSTIPVEVFQYRQWYRRWQTRPCVDVTGSLLTVDKYARAWSWLVQRNQTEAIRYLLGQMGLDPKTGLLPYSAVDTTAYGSFNETLAGIEFTPYSPVMEAITSEGVDLAAYNEAPGYVPFDPNGISSEQIVSEPGQSLEGQGGVSGLLAVAAVALGIFAAVFNFLSRRAKLASANLKEKEKEKQF